jgi:uncharacterized membrane protein
MENLLTDAQKTQVIRAIKAAEKNTSGEIKVHIEGHCQASHPVERAVEVFWQLGMNQTQQRNGVLFYLASQDRKFAIIGDEGIHQVVDEDFWNSTKNLMRDYLCDDKIVEALEKGIEEIGHALKRHFPYQTNDENEISDDISFG